MSKKNRKWILRSLQVLISLVLMLSVVPAEAYLGRGYLPQCDGDKDCYGYLHHDKAEDANYKPYTNPDWMADIPGHRHLSELSIPETHDSLCTTGGFLPETQSLDLITQLNSGIRSFDLRLRRDYGTLEIWHGIHYCNYNFRTVLDIVVAFLEAHPNETILMRLAENTFSPHGWGNYDFIDMLNDDLQPYLDWIWTPTSTNPTLGEVRGKIVILEHFSQMGEQVDWGDENDVGMYSSLALDSDDNPHISYYDNNEDDLKYAYKDSDGWHDSDKKVDDAGDVGQYTSLALSMDADGNPYPHISYYDATNDNLKYAYKQTNGGWWFAPIDTSDNDVGQYSSLALSKAVDEKGNPYPHISYYDADNNDLLYAFKDSSGWHFETVEYAGEVGQYTSLALDDNDYPHISYYDSKNGDLKYARKMPGDPDWWWVGPVDGEDNDVGQYSSIALDEYNQPHISYYDNTEHNLKYASGTDWDDVKGWVWERSQVDHGSANDVGMYSSLALDTFNNPHISYYDNNTDDLKYTFFDNNSGWVFQVVETGGTEDVKRNVGLYTSLALDENNHPRISHYDATERDLMYAGLTSFCGDGVSAITQYGLKDKLPCFKEKEYWSFTDNEEIYTEKWWRVKDQLIEADAGSLDRFYLNGLNGNGGTSEPYPWFIASGHVNSATDADNDLTGENCKDPSIKYSEDFPCKDGKMLYEGTNELTLNYLIANPPLWRPRRWGIVVTDFPGRDLIDAIIQSNFQTVPTVWLPAIVR